MTKNYAPSVIHTKQKKMENRGANNVTGVSNVDMFLRINEGSGRIIIRFYGTNTYLANKHMSNCQSNVGLE